MSEALPSEPTSRVAHLSLPDFRERWAFWWAAVRASAFTWIVVGITAIGLYDTVIGQLVPADLAQKAPRLVDLRPDWPLWAWIIVILSLCLLAILEGTYGRVRVIERTAAEKLGGLEKQLTAVMNAHPNLELILTNTQEKCWEVEIRNTGAGAEAEVVIRAEGESLDSAWPDHQVFGTWSHDSTVLTARINKGGARFVGLAERDGPMVIDSAYCWDIPFTEKWDSGLSQTPSTGGVSTRRGVEGGAPLELDIFLKVTAQPDLPQGAIERHYRAVGLDIVEVTP